MKDSSVDQLFKDAKAGKISRRTLVSSAAAVGASAALMGTAAAQATPDASPVASPGASPAASPAAYTGPVGTISVSREDFYKALNEKFQFTKADKTGGTLIQLQTSDLTTLNPLLSSDTYSTQIIQLYNDTLVQTSPIDGTYVPSLADSWEIAADGRTYTFHLHKGVTWSDGQPFTADDVVYSFDATVDEKSLSPRRADVLSVLESYRKIDDLTVELVAQKPFATFLSKTVAEVGIAPKHIWESVSFDQWGADPGSTGTDASRVVGTGAFLFKEWVQNDHVTLEKNPNYWNAANVPVNIDEFIYRVVADSNAALTSFTSGEVDILQQVQPAQAEQLKKSNPEI
ncbi:MAG TPA: ABC transporter substrate-binding protein, partial [Thermomicrobiales bacterium]|nr:ABC transporter substrate-binding protein [Thermomicrobiales bacterium]